MSIEICLVLGSLFLSGSPANTTRLARPARVGRVSPRALR